LPNAPTFAWVISICVAGVTLQNTWTSGWVVKETVAGFDRYAEDLQRGALRADADDDALDNQPPFGKRAGLPRSFGVPTNDDERDLRQLAGQIRERKLIVKVYLRHPLHAKVLSISRVIRELPERTRRYRVVLIDEPHNLRNREGKRWRVIRDYIERNDNRCILLSATPYNKTYLDLSAQLGLFLREDHRHPTGKIHLRIGQ